MVLYESELYKFPSLNDKSHVLNVSASAFQALHQTAHDHGPLYFQAKLIYAHDFMAGV